MTCHRIPGGIICMTPFFRLPLADGTRVYMEWHSFLGPMFFRDGACNRPINEWYKNPLLIQASEWFMKRGYKA